MSGKRLDLCVVLAFINVQKICRFLDTFSGCFASVSVSYYCDEIIEDSHSEGIHQDVSKKSI